MSARTPLAFLTTLCVLVAGLVAGTSTSLEAYAAGKSGYEKLDTFARTLGHIQDHYFESREPTSLIEAALDGMVGSLDPHSTYFSPEEYAAMLADAEGKYYGVGIEVTPSEKGGLLIVEILENGPAKNSGLRRNDHIVSVDGEDVTKLHYQEIVQRIRGPRGEEVTFAVLRVGLESPLEFRIVRDQVLTPSVTSEWAEEGIGYIRISQFRRNSSAEIADAIRAFNEEGLRSLIIDVRHNPGGLLEEAISTVDLFLSEGVIVSIESRRAEEDEIHRARQEGTVTSASLVVLLDQGSASAAEIVAGALQDHDRATVVGTTSYGKGSVQSVFEYPDQSALKLTIARYNLPSGRSLEDSGGVEPDQMVGLAARKSPAAQQVIQELEELALESEDRDVLERVLKKLRNQDTAPRRPSFRGTFQERLGEDAQLQAALEALREQPTP
ncbi:MAG: S41 family peptidase [Myxococcota bacterium]|nr:S41 family peptidase [Myxococcota bacterium]